MTYKKIVEGMVRRDSIDWVEELLNEHDIKFKWVWDCGVNFEQEKELVYYDILCEVIMSDYYKVYVMVGGTIDDSGIAHSVVWDADKKNIIWMEAKETREFLGISEFKIA